jgi:hypothetical protein
MKTVAKSAGLLAAVLLLGGLFTVAHASSASVQGCTLTQIETIPSSVQIHGPIDDFWVHYKCQREESGVMELWYKSPTGSEQQVGVIHNHKFLKGSMRAKLIQPGRFRIEEGCFIAKLKIRGSEARLQECTGCTQVGIRHVHVREH